MTICYFWLKLNVKREVMDQNNIFQRLWAQEQSLYSFENEHDACGVGLL